MYTKQQVAEMIISASGARKTNEHMLWKVRDNLYDKEYKDGDQITCLPYTNCFEIKDGKVRYYAGQDHISELKNFRAWTRR